jgi:hypothetical protein
MKTPYDALGVMHGVVGPEEAAPDWRLEPDV